MWSRETTKRRAQKSGAHDLQRGGSKGKAALLWELGLELASEGNLEDVRSLLVNCGYQEGHGSELRDHIYLRWTVYTVFYLEGEAITKKHRACVSAIARVVVSRTATGRVVPSLRQSKVRRGGRSCLTASEQYSGSGQVENLKMV
jgi:hypothetical protein